MTVIGAGSGLWAALADGLDTPGDVGPAADVWGRLTTLVDPGAWKPKLAPDIEIKRFERRWGEDYTMIANPRDLVHFRLDPGDAETVQLMDGTRTIKQILIERFRESGDLELSGVADLVRELHRSNFLATRFVDVEEATKRALDPISSGRRKAREFAKTLRVDWDNADRLVQRLYRYGFRWFFRRQVAAASLAVAIGGLVAFFADVQSKRFSLTGDSLAIGFLVLLFMDYFSVFIHELGHALVLTHNGRHIGSAGFMIYFGSPAFFVESSDSMMMEKREEILSSFAGPYGQMLIGGICSLVALAAPGWALSETLYRVAVLNYFMVFMNLLPMLELDGYFILSDAIEQPELRTDSLQFVQHGLFHKLRHRERLTRKEVALALYGILGMLFTVFSFYTSYFYWKSVFGGFVSRLWNGGTTTRALLVILALFVAGPIIRGGLGVVRGAVRRLRLVARRVRFRLERSWRVEAAALIDALPLFDDVPAGVLGDLAGRVRLRSLSPGQPVVRQGERATAFYIVRKGVLQAVEEDPSSGTERSLRILGRGEAFGELGLKEARPRSATVRAVDEAQVFEIDKGTFDRLLADMIQVPQFEPTLQAVRELKALPAFSHLEPDELSEVLAHGEWVNVPPGETIVEEGTVGDVFFAIGSGQVDVFREDELLRTMGPGAYFGEVALLLDVPRTATVEARTPVRMFRLDRDGFDRLVATAFRKGTLNPHSTVGRVSQH